jgi:hypothetical protein
VCSKDAHAGCASGSRSARIAPACHIRLAAPRRSRQLSVRRTFLVFAAAPPGISCTGSRAFSIAIRAGILWDRRRRCRDL